MATNICFTNVAVIGGQAFEDAKAPNQNLTSSGTSQATTLTAGNNADVLVVETDTTVWVAVGASPTASEGTDRLCQANSTRYFTGITEGDKVAVINA
ncbi:MAG: hypothetical protein AB8B85_16820 [Paracoccaceae bacterium]